MPRVCGVQFRGTGKTYYFGLSGQDEPRQGDYVIVDTSRGRELGQVVLGARDVPDQEIVGDLKPIVRSATTLDLLDAQRYRRQEEDAVATIAAKVAEAGLDMKVVGAEYNYDGSRLTCFFTAEQRVDFRQLVRELARVFKTRIELRQIGVRDEARIIGGLGKCGRALCCATWLTDFEPVSIRMAKQQNLPLSPMEISGICGRLLCCLLYENDYYGEVKARFPRVGRTIDTHYGPAKVIRVSVLKETVTLLLPDGEKVELTDEELRNPPSPDAVAPGQARAQQAQRQLDEVLGGSETRSAAARPSGKRQPDAERESSSESGNRSSKSSSRRRRRPSGNASPPTSTEEDTEGSLDTGTRSRRSSSRRRRRRPRQRKEPGSSAKT